MKLLIINKKAQNFQVLLSQKTSFDNLYYLKQIL